MNSYDIRIATANEFKAIGKLMVDVYSQLDGFPKPKDQPQYFELLANVGSLTTQSTTKILVAINSINEILGAVVYFDDMQYYGSGGSAVHEKHAAGFRLLSVSSIARGQGVGKSLSLACVRRAKHAGHQQLVIHTTKAMQTAWKMYERLGFYRSTDLDFNQGDLNVFGFRLNLSECNF